MENINFDSLKRRRDLRIILPVFLVSIIACIDRVNISYAKLTMTQTLGWLSPEVYGLAPVSSLPVTCCWKIPGSLFAAKILGIEMDCPASCSPGAPSVSVWPSLRRSGNSISAASS